MEPIIESASPFWAIVVQLAVVAIGLYAIGADISKRTVLSETARDRIRKTALAFVPTESLREQFSDLRKRISKGFIGKAKRSWGSPRPPRQDYSGCPYSTEAFRNYEDYATALQEYYLHALSLAVTNEDFGRLGLRLYSDAFVFNNLGHKRRQTAQEGLQPDVVPFARYLERRYSGVFEAFTNRSAGKGGHWLTRVTTLLRDLLPTSAFKVIGFFSFLLLASVIAQPVPFLVGPQAMSFKMRYFEWIVASIALVCTFLVFHRVCYEQWRFRCLIEDLQS